MESSSRTAAAGAQSIEWGRRTPAQWFCLVGGIYFVLRGVAGVFVDFEFSTPGEGWHTLFHFGTGIVLVAVSSGRDVARTFAIAFGVLYGIVALVGLVDGSDVAGVVPVQTLDNTIHSLIAAASLATGLLSRRR